MLDIKFIRQNPEAVKKAARDKNIDVNVDELLNVDEKRRELIQKSEALRAKQKRTQDREEAAAIKLGFKELEKQLKEAEIRFQELMIKVPTVPSPDTPIGKDAGSNTEVYSWGKIPKFDFEPKDHIELAASLDLVDFDKGTKISGFRGYYLKNEGAMLVMALMLYAFNKMIEKGYRPMIPPTLVKSFVLSGSGYFRGLEYDPEVDEIYEIASAGREEGGEKGKDRKFLIGTAEPSILAYFSDEVLKEENLPIKLCGFSQCYRSEIGSYGKDTKGLYRVHEFMKVEQVVVAKADIVESNALQDEMVSIVREMHQELELPFRQVQLCTGDMSAGKYRAFDTEAWLPGSDRWAETGSASNFLDWQARRLNVKYESPDGERKYAYLLNNTALPSPRPFMAILENYQTKKGTVKVPKVLQKYMLGVKEIKLQKGL